MTPGFMPELLTESKVLFENRADAGKKLAAGLTDYTDQNAIVMAIPNGGVPLAVQVASIINADIGIMLCRKLSLPLNQEGGLGAVADDGTSIINEDIMKKDGITQEQIEHEVERVKDNIRQRRLLYKVERPAPRLNGRTAIIVDDGLASGITMSVAVEAVRHRKPEKVVVAVPVAAGAAYDKLSRLADRVVTCAVGRMSKFFLVDYFRVWKDVTDKEVVLYLEQWKRQHVVSLETYYNRRRG